MTPDEADAFVDGEYDDDEAGDDEEWSPEDEDDLTSWEEDDDEEEQEWEDIGKRESDAYYERHRDFYEDYETSNLVPRIPQQMRGTDIVGLRTRGNGTVGVEIGSEPRRLSQEAWDSLTPLKRYILMLVSEHRHMTLDQLSTFTVLPTRVRRANEDGAKKMIAATALEEELGRKPTKMEVTERVKSDDERMMECRLRKMAEKRGIPVDKLPERDVRRARKCRTRDSLKSYMRWLSRDKYGQELNYKNTTKCMTMRGLRQAVTDLVKEDLLDLVAPSYKVKGQPRSYTDTPALFDEHYYLSAHGARVLVAMTRIKGPNARGGNTVGYVPTHLDAAYTSIVHETECTECLLSLVRCSQYLSNIEVFDPGAEEVDFGYVDVVRCYHEKDCEEKRIDWRGSDGVKGIDFKSDGLVTLYSSQLRDYIDLYLEYDAGSSKRRNISHKVEAYLKHILAMSDEFKKRGRTFRKPVLLLVSQKPSSFITAINNGRTTQYTAGIKMMVGKKCFDGIRNELNDIGLVLVTDCNALRQHGALGACWHKMDLLTGIAEGKAYDLLTSVSDFVASNAW